MPFIAAGARLHYALNTCVVTQSFRKRARVGDTHELPRRLILENSRIIAVLKLKRFRCISSSEYGIDKPMRRGTLR
jgi:hypothetical protein